MDRDLLQTIMDSARIPTAVQASPLGLPAEDVERPLARMEAAGIIQAHRTVVDLYVYSLYVIERGPVGPAAPELGA